MTQIARKLVLTFLAFHAVLDHSFCTVTNETENFNCTRDGFVAHPQNCQAFYWCSLRTIVLECEENKIFDTETSKCAHPWQSSRTECGGTLHVSNEVESFDNLRLFSDSEPLAQFRKADSDCIEEDFIPHEDDCKKFYRCVNMGRGHFKKYEFSCGDGTIWDPDLNACNYQWATRNERCRNYVEETYSPLNNGEAFDAYNANNNQEYVGENSNLDYNSSTNVIDQTYPYLYSQGTQIRNPEGLFNVPIKTRNSQEYGGDNPNLDYNSSNVIDQSYPQGTQIKNPEELFNVPSSTFAPLSNECQQEGFIGDSSDCKKFYRCVANGQRSFTKYEFSCGEGTVWDSEINSCNFPYAVRNGKCGMSSTNNTPTIIMVINNSTHQISSPFVNQTNRPDIINSGQSSSSSTINNNNNQLSIQSTTTVATTTQNIITDSPTNAEGNKSNVECTKEGFIQDNKDCKIFYQCVKIGGNSFRKYQFTCGENTVWDTELNTCNHQWAVRNACGTNIQTDSTSQNNSSTSSSTQDNYNNQNMPSNSSNTQDNSNSQNTQTSESSTQNISTTNSSSSSGFSQETSTNSQNIESSSQSPATSTTTVESTTISSILLNSTTSQETSTLSLLNTTNSASTDSLNFDSCRQDGYIGDSKDCRKFYRCVEFTRGKFTKYEFTCGENTVWDSEQTTCNHPTAVKNNCRTTFSGSNNTKSSTTSSNVDTTNTSTQPSIQTENSNISTSNSTDTELTNTSITSSSSSETTEENVYGQQNSKRCSTEGFVGDPTDCKKFYRCVDNRRGGYTTYSFTCGEQTAWDQELQTCSWPSSNICNKKLTDNKPDSLNNTIDSNSNKTTENSSTDNTNIVTEVSVTETTDQTQSTASETSQSVTETTDQTQSTVSETSQSVTETTDQTQNTTSETSQSVTKTTTVSIQTDSTVTSQSTTENSTEISETSNSVTSGTITETSQTVTETPESVTQTSTYVTETSSTVTDISETISATSETVTKEPITDISIINTETSSATTDTTNSIVTTPETSGSITEVTAPTETSGTTESTNQNTQTEALSTEKTPNPFIDTSSSTNNTQSTTTEPVTDINTLHNNENKCVKEGDMANTRNCQKFIKCVSDGRGGFIKYDFHCAGGTVWDSDLNTCNYPSAVKNNKCKSAANIPNDQCIEEGFFPNSKDCKKFYRCVNNGRGGYTKYDFNCGDGTVWDPDLITCNYPYATKNKACSNTDQVHTTTTTTTTEKTTITEIASVTSPKQESTTSAQVTTTEIQTTDSETVSQQTESTITPENESTTESRTDKIETTEAGTTIEQYTTDLVKETTILPESTTSSQTETTDLETKIEQSTTELQRETTVDSESTTTIEISTTDVEKSTIDTQTSSIQTTETTDAPEVLSTSITTEISTTESEISSPTVTDVEKSTIDTQTNSVQTTETTDAPEVLSTSITTEISTTESEISSPTVTDLIETTPQDREQITTSLTELSTIISTTDGSTDSLSTVTAATETGSETFTSGTEGTVTTQDPSTTEVDSTSNQFTTPCPISQLENDQISLVCPTGFKRHPKYCNLFYQCTTNTETFDIKVLVLSCPPGLIYDDEMIQCLPPEETKQVCTNQIAEKKYPRNFADNLSPMEIESKAPLCPGTGNFPLNPKQCDNNFIKCQKSNTSKRSMRGLVYQCPKGFTYWPISKKCERQTPALPCTNNVEDYQTKWHIPVEKSNLSHKS